MFGSPLNSSGQPMFRSGQAQPRQPQQQGTPYGQPFSDGPWMGSPQEERYSQAFQPAWQQAGARKMMGPSSMQAYGPQPWFTQTMQTPFGQASPSQYYQHRDAFIQTANNQMGQYMANAGVYQGQGAPPSTWGQPPQFNVNQMWGQAGDMVQGGWQNPFAGQVYGQQVPQPGSPYPAWPMVQQPQQASHTVITATPLDQPTVGGWPDRRPSERPMSGGAEARIRELLQGYNVPPAVMSQLTSLLGGVSLRPPHAPGSNLRDDYKFQDEPKPIAPVYRPPTQPLIASPATQEDQRIGEIERTNPRLAARLRAQAEAQRERKAREAEAAREWELRKGQFKRTFYGQDISEEEFQRLRSLTPEQQREAALEAQKKQSGRI